jgi:acyl carrier protein
MANIASLTPSDRLKIFAIIREQSKKDIVDLGDSTNLREHAGLDSLDAVELLGEVEKEFVIDLGWESVDRVKTVADLLAIVAAARQATC